MFDLSPATHQYIATFSLALAGVLLFLFMWRRREQRREEALEILEKISPWGIEPLNKILRAYAIGNYLGTDSVGRTIREVIRDLKGEGLVGVLKRLGWKVVKGVFLKNTEDRTTLRKLLVAAELAAEDEIETIPET